MGWRGINVIEKIGHEEIELREKWECTLPTVAAGSCTCVVALPESGKAVQRNKYQLCSHTLTNFSPKVFACVILVFRFFGAVTS